jgi:hypothetical protein
MFKYWNSSNITVTEMSISIDDAKRYAGLPDLQVQILKLLRQERKALTGDSIGEKLERGKMSFLANEAGSYWTVQNVAGFALSVASRVTLDLTLDRMVSEGKIQASEVGDKTYFFVDEDH